MNKQIGLNIKTIRKSKGISQSLVSKKLGYKSSSSLCEIESGKKGIDVEKLPTLCKVLDCSLNQIFFGSEVHDMRIKAN